MDLHELPEGDWQATGRHTFCPVCQSPEVYVRLALVPDEPQGSLAGAQVKFAMHEEWVFFCRGCGATGPASQRESVTQRVERGEEVPGHDPETCKACAPGSLANTEPRFRVQPGDQVRFIGELPAVNYLHPPLAAGDALTGQLPHMEDGRCEP